MSVTNNYKGIKVSVVDPIPAGTNNIGDIDVLSLPSIPAGTNLIGKVRLTNAAATTHADPISSDFPPSNPEGLPVITAYNPDTGFGGFIRSDDEGVISVRIRNETGMADVHATDPVNDANGFSALYVMGYDTDDGYRAFTIDHLTNRLLVDIGNTGTVAISGTPSVSISGTPNVAVTSIAAGANTIGHVKLLDNAVGTFLQYPKIDASVAGTEAGIVALVKRDDTPAVGARVSANGDALTLITDNYGKLWVADCYAEDTAHTSGDRGSFVMGIRHDNIFDGDTTYIATSNKDYMGLQTDALGALWIAGSQVEDAVHGTGDRGIFAMGVLKFISAGAKPAVLAANGDYTALIMDDTGGLWTANCQVEDAAHTSGDRGSLDLGVRKDDYTTQPCADGDYSYKAVDSIARTKVNTGWITNTKVFTAAGVGTTVNCSLAPVKYFSLQVIKSGAVANWTIVLEGSLDGTNFTPILTHTNVAPGDLLMTAPAASPVPVLYWRVNCTVYGIGGTNLTAIGLAMN